MNEKTGLDPALARAEPAHLAFGVNAGGKMHRRAGVKMHHGRNGEGLSAGMWRSTGQGQPKLSFPVRSMNLLSRPDLHPPATARSVGDGRSGATRSTAS